MKEEVNSLRELEPKVKVLENKFFSLGIQIFGGALLSFCVYRWLVYFFIYNYYKPLTHTTFLTLILISFTCINKFESILLNSAVSMSFLLFVLVTIFFIPLATDVISFIEGVILHAAIAIFQIFLIVNKKIVISKKYLLWSFLFYLIFISSYDSFARIIAAIDMDKQLSMIEVIVLIFYILCISTTIVYFFKKKFGILLP